MVRTEAGAHAPRRGVGVLNGNGRRFLGALAGAATLVFAGGADAADDPLLKRFIGEWVGTGSFRYDSISGADPLWCKVSGILNGDGTLHESGRCSLPDQAASFSADIRPMGGGKYAGTASAVLGLAKAPEFTGSGKGAQLVLTLTMGENGPVTVVLDAFSGGFTMRAERTDPDTGKKYQPVNVKFGPP